MLQKSNHISLVCDNNVITKKNGFSSYPYRHIHLETQNFFGKSVIIVAKKLTAGGAKCPNDIT